jgi:hypothetical protein
VTRRSPREGTRATGNGDPERPGTGGRERPGHGGKRPSPGLATQLAISTAAFAASALVAELAGAANLGIAFGVGQIVFAITLVYLLLRG